MADVLLSWPRCSVAAPAGATGSPDAGWATLALIASLAWLMPWYVIWVRRWPRWPSVRLRRTALALTVFLVLVFLPCSGKFWSLIHFDPLSGSAGQVSQTLQGKLSWYS